MNRLIKVFSLFLCALLLTSCSMQGQFVHLGKVYEAKPLNSEVEVFLDTIPDRPFESISRLDVHIEKTHFVGSKLEEALPELKAQARLSGADAIIEIEEKRSMYLETKIYHVTAIGIKYTE